MTDLIEKRISRAEKAKSRCLDKDMINLVSAMNKNEEILASDYSQTLYFEFTGGEVTLFPELLDLCDYIHNLGHTIGIISNGTRHHNWWDKQKDKFDHVCFSYHAEHTKPSKFFNVVKACGATWSW